MEYLAVFAASFIYVALRSFQQLNVTGRKYWWIMPTSMCMAIFDVYLVATYARNGLGLIVVAAGLGGGLGSIMAMRLHDYIHRTNNGSRHNES